MGRKLLALVPELPAAELERFHADATDAPLLSVLTWTSADKRSRQVALDASKTRLLELQRVQSERSWFVGGRVQQDASLTVFSPVDALFVLLDASWALRGRFQSLFDVLSGPKNAWLLQLSSLTRERVELVCDVQDVGEDGLENLYVKASEEKVLKWLKNKVQRASKVLAHQEKQRALKAAGSGAFDAQVKLPGQKQQTQESAEVTEEDVKRCHREAIDVVANYLPEEFVGLLCKQFEVSQKVEVKAAAASTSSGLDAIKRFDRRQSAENGSKRPTPSSAGGAKKKSKLANVDRTGMKSLTSFFTKK